MTKATTIPIDVAWITQRLINRFMSKVRASGTCLLWTGGDDGGGYGKFRIGPRKYMAHRVAYVIANHADIEEGMVIDHLCRNHGCVNPDHLDVVTISENNRRGFAASGPTMRALARSGLCARGHDMSLPSAWYDHPSGRTCRQCLRARAARYATARKERSAPRLANVAT